VTRVNIGTGNSVAKTLTGNLDTFSLADLLQWLEINALSGRVIVRRGDIVRMIDLKGGAIVFVSSSKPEERLGIFLKKNDLLPEQVLYELLAESFALGKNLTRLILERELLSRERLAEAVEGLATQILLDLFDWPGATFEFDPHYVTEDLIRIHLSLRGQVLAFHGAKAFDDKSKANDGGSGFDEASALWEAEFRPDALAASFWTILESLPGTVPETAALRENFQWFCQFADRVHRRLSEPFRLFPLYDDTAAMLRGALEEGADSDRIVQIAALDPFLTVDMLYLANALKTDRSALLATPRDAATAVGAEALRRLCGLLADSSTPKVPSGEQMERVIRRVALSTAVAASHLAETFNVRTEEAYTLGLLETLGSYDLLKLLIAVAFQPGPVRAAALNRFRTVFGHVLARKLNLPQAVEEVLGATGRVTAQSPTSEQLVFFAKQMVPSKQIGLEWTSEDPALADRYTLLSQRSGLRQLIARDAKMLREILQL
jgi:HD-like signal output (HDOD) protein